MFFKNNFINFGTYNDPEGAILKRELEKAGIIAKALYPGTNVGTESTAHAHFSAYTLLVQSSNIPRAQEIRKKLNINPVQEREAMALPVRGQTS